MALWRDSVGLSPWTFLTAMSSLLPIKKSYTYFACTGPNRGRLSPPVINYFFLIIHWFCNVWDEWRRECFLQFRQFENLVLCELNINEHEFSWRWRSAWVHARFTRDFCSPITPSIIEEFYFIVQVDIFENVVEIFQKKCGWDRVLLVDECLILVWITGYFFYFMIFILTHREFCFDERRSLIYP